MVANTDGLSSTGYMHFPVILSNYNGVTAYICRRFISTTAFLAGKYNCTVNCFQFLPCEAMLAQYVLSHCICSSVCLSQVWALSNPYRHANNIAR